MNGFVNQGEEFDQAAVVDRKPRAVARGGSRYENCWERLNVSQAELFLDLLKGGGGKRLMGRPSTREWQSSRQVRGKENG